MKPVLSLPNIRVSSIGAAVVGTVLVASLLLQQHGMLPAADQALRRPVSKALVNIKVIKGGLGGPAAPCDSSRGPEGGYAAAAAGAATFSMPSITGSCSINTTSSFPYVGNDVFLDYAHQVFKQGSSLNLKGPGILFLHPQDAPAFAALVPQLQHEVVLVSNSNFDQCLPWSHGDNTDSWRPHVDAILNSSMVSSWWVLLGMPATCMRGVHSSRALLLQACVTGTFTCLSSQYAMCSTTTVCAHNSSAIRQLYPCRMQHAAQLQGLKTTPYRASTECCCGTLWHCVCSASHILQHTHAVHVHILALPCLGSCKLPLGCN